MAMHLETAASVTEMERMLRLRRAEERARIMANAEAPEIVAFWQSPRQRRRPFAASFATAGLIALVIGLVALFGPAIDSGAAQDASPAAADLPAFIVEYGTAWSSGDPDQVLALYAEETVFTEYVLDGVVATSHEELGAYAGAAFAAFTDFAITPTGGFIAGDQVAIEWVLSGSYTGTFGTLPPGTGQMVEVRGASIITLADGKIVSQAEYWDVATLLAQVGVL
jgi:steroid delta-isomerase-like uncharacterized protein